MNKGLIHQIIGPVIDVKFDPEQMPEEYVNIVRRGGTQRGAADYIACMTDAYAVKT